MPNMKKLKGLMTEKDMSVDSLAAKIGLDKSTLYRWLSNNGDNMTIDAANAIYRELDMTPELAHEIFFGK